MMLGKRKQSAMEAPLPSPTLPADLGSAIPNAVHKIPRLVQYTSPVPYAPPPPSTGAQRCTTASLPLNLIALIVSYLDDVGDIARITRTSRLMYYMALPSLYEKVNLHSYAEIRHINGRPEGFGSGSPFVMALNGLVTKQHASFVREFRIWGEWKELGVDDFAKGRVPENSMMLNILLRAATDKMEKLQSFSWELDCKPLKTLYQGLGAHNSLTSLTLRFPSTRVPRPSVLIPPMVNLRAFRALDIDPMCYPDDISMLMLHSKKLEDVRMHFSPRMRQEGEAIMNLAHFFGRCHKANYKLKLKHFALHNFFGPNVLGFEDIFDADVVTSVTFLDTFGSRDPKTVFVDSTWDNVPPDIYTKFTRVRANEVSKTHIELLKRSKAKMEYFTLVNEKRKKSGFTPPSDTHSSPATVAGTPSTDTVETDPETISLWPDLLHALTRYHGDSLRHLLLLDCWALSPDDIAEIVRFCPNLEELGLAINTSDHNIMRLMMPFLVNLRALRVHMNEHMDIHLKSMTSEERMWAIGYDVAAKPNSRIKLISFGDLHYKVGNVVELIREDGTVERRKEMSIVGKEEALKYDIWRLDVLDLSVDPVAPFSR